MPKPYPSEFRDEVVGVAQNREPGVTIEQIAKDFAVHSITLQSPDNAPPSNRLIASAKGGH